VTPQVVGGVLACRRRCAFLSLRVSPTVLSAAVGASLARTLPPGGPHMLERVQTAVIGGGVVGLAVARALSRSGREVLLLESESLTGSGTSSRNSEVVHAGIYYTAGSLKARACVAGRRALYAFCEANAVPYSRCGKLLVATEEGELAQLDAIAEKARANGLTGSGEALVLLTSAEAARLEPEVRCVGALHSPSTGTAVSGEARQSDQRLGHRRGMGGR